MTEQQQNKDAREALEHVKRVLMRGGTAGMTLWNVLAALRGPDSADFNLKECTTAVIRHAALGDAPEIGAGATVRRDSEELQERRSRLFTSYGDAHVHFFDHAHGAFRALRTLGYLP